MTVFPPGLLFRLERERCISALVQNHYSRSVPSGASHYFKHGDAIVVFSVPANNNISEFLIGRPNRVWELSRLWAPDGHERNLLTHAISQSVRGLRQIEPTIEALVSYADPNVGHEGRIYRAASWVYTGQSEESRVYEKDGQIVSRRAFHSGKTFLTKTAIEAAGAVEKKLPGKHRFVLGLSRRSRSIFRKKWGRVD